MNITEIRIKLLFNSRDKLRGFASVTLDNLLVVRDIKIIEGGRGLFVAMPSRKLCDRCSSCAAKNPIRSRYCSECGARLSEGRGDLDERGRPRLYADIAHPINQEARDFVQSQILRAYSEEFERSKQEGYVAKSFDDLDYDYLDEHSADAER
ncbi:MAG: septation protein SpoVG family protein [Planctomycetes bacterium]|nr:septation protein SpoVG family protein [Planctomycetota bacterium]